MIKDYVSPADGKYNISNLLEIVSLLRSENGCPWDKVQTHESIRSSLIEETYEAADAIDKNDMEALKEELGDVLLQVVFHAQIEREKKNFDFDDICDRVCRKLILRHPHVFGNAEADTPDEVLDNWDNIKRMEKSQKTFTDTLLSVPEAFPALMRAQKLQKRASKAGYDFIDVNDAMDKLSEELCELSDAISSENEESIFEEVGDILFSTVNVARLVGADAENALTKSSDKFVRRFAAAEKSALDQGKSLDTLSPEELDSLWNNVKKNV